MVEVIESKLDSTIRKIRKKVQRLKDRNETVGETNTKAALIDPILAALGWDLGDLDEVRREYRRKPKDNPVDYALMLLRQPRLFVEAKSLEKNIDDRKWILQTLSYATAVGVKWCVLTNGDEYRLYNSHAPVDVDHKLFRAVKISEEAQEEFAIRTLELLSKDKMSDNSLDVLWRAHFIDNQVKQVLQELFRDVETGLVRLIRKKTKVLKPSEIRESLKRADIYVEFPIKCFTEPVKIPKSKELILEPKKKGKIKSSGVELQALVRAGLIKTPMKIETKYKGTEFKAQILKSGKCLLKIRNMAPCLLQQVLLERRL